MPQVRSEAQGWCMLRQKPPSAISCNSRSWILSRERSAFCSTSADVALREELPPPTSTHCTIHAHKHMQKKTPGLIYNLIDNSRKKKKHSQGPEFKLSLSKKKKKRLKMSHLGTHEANQESLEHSAQFETPLTWGAACWIFGLTSSLRCWRPAGAELFGVWMRVPVLMALTVSSYLMRSRINPSSSGTLATDSSSTALLSVVPLG